MKAIPSKILLAAGAALALSACAESRLRLSPDFGEAVHENVVAQTADPDAHYAGSPAAGSSGARAAAATDRYTRDQVIPPVSSTTSLITSNGNQGAAAAPAASPSQ